MAEISYREALNQALREEMDRDERVFIMGEEVGYFGGAFKVTDGLLAVYGEKRVRDTPISELTIVGSGIGAAMGGLRPIVELMTVNFGLLALDQIVNHAAKIRYMFGGKAKVPIVIRAPQGAGHQLGAQHSQSLEAYFLHCPGLRVVIPATPADAKGLLRACLRQDLARSGLFVEGLGQMQGLPALIGSSRRPWVIFIVTSLLPAACLAVYVYLAVMVQAAGEQRFIIQQSVVMLVSLLLAGTALVAVLSRTLRRVTNSLEHGLRFLRQGQFDGRVPVLMDDEMGELARGLNTALQGMQEREDIKDSLRIASEIHEGLLPRTLPVAYAGVMVPVALKPTKPPTLDVALALPVA